MPGPYDSGDVHRPRGRGRCCCCCCSFACCKIYHFHSAVVLIILILIFLGCGAFSLSSQITLESLCYVAIACLYAFTPSSRKERTLSGIFLSLLAAVIVVSAANYKRSKATVVVMSVSDLIALAVYCIWKLRSRDGCTEVPAAEAEVPLAPLQAEEARCSAPVQQVMLHPEDLPLKFNSPRCSAPVQVQQTTIHIEQLPRKFTYNEIRSVTGDFGTMVGRGGSGEVFRGLLDDGRAVAVKRITSDKPVGETDFLRLRLDKLGLAGIGGDPGLRWKQTHAGFLHTWIHKRCIWVRRGRRKTRSIHFNPPGKEISSPEVGTTLPSRARSSLASRDSAPAADSPPGLPATTTPRLTLEGFQYTVAAGGGIGSYRLRGRQWHLDNCRETAIYSNISTIF